MVPDIEIASTADARAKATAAADALLAAVAVEQEDGDRSRFRGGYPALTWLAKKDERAAASLWLVARRLVPEAANDNQPADAEGMAVERRGNGRPRGQDPKPMSREAYLALPSEKPRLDDPELQPVEPRGFHGDYELKAQESYPLSPSFRFTKCEPAIARGAIFLGARSGLGQPKQGKSRGDTRRVELPEMPSMPEEVAVTVDAVLARADLAGVGEAHGARGGYADRAGKRALLAAADWAQDAIAA